MVRNISGRSARGVPLLTVSQSGLDVGKHLFKQPGRTGKVDTLEEVSRFAEHRAFIKPHTGLIAQKIAKFFRSIEAQASAIEPSQVSAFRFNQTNAAYTCSEVADEPEIAFQHFHQCVQPRFGMVVGGLACDHTEMVDGQAADIIRRRIVTTLEMRVRDDGVGAQQTSQIEGFGRRGEFKDDIRVLSPNVENMVTLCPG